MSLNLPVRPADRDRAVKAMTAVATNDQAALDAVLTDTATDKLGGLGLVMAVLEYADWLSRTTPPLPGEPDPWDGPDDDSHTNDDS